MTSDFHMVASVDGFTGRPLVERCGAPMPVAQFLTFAVASAAALADMHERGIIHRDIKPHNILVDDTTGEVRFTGFGLASRLPREQPAARSPGVLEGTFAYMSPEQTGRVNRCVDDRTDLYSLGVTFYELLTGGLPFEASDALGWAHCHIARAPAPPVQLVPSVPKAVSELVLKLLAKTAEDRYESARSLQLDLERCLSEWRSTGRIEPFPLGELGMSGRFHIPQKLYGRDGEVASLLRAFERVIDRGTPELVLVSGYSGVGKSSLVQELQKPVVRERGSFLSGKFDQYKRNIPYATLIQAFQSLVAELLSESEERVDAWRCELRTALGANGQIIVDVLPQLEMILGKQPPVPELPMAESQNRFMRVFGQFIGVFARKERPLALFLDDVQWADLASLKLLQHVATHPETKYLLVIAAYRDNEVDPSHPLMLALDEIRKAGARVDAIVVEPLAREHLDRLVADTLRCSLEQAEPLSRMVHEKTGGNPFFAIQFLSMLSSERMIEFDPRSAAWRWDVAKIRQQGFTDNVVDLMVGKLKRLPAAAQEMLKLAACVGNTADVHTLSVISGRAEEEVHKDVYDAVKDGLVLRSDGAFRFLHDRVQQAAYSLIPEDQRAEVHLRVGRLLLARTPREAVPEQVFTLVNQLNRGASLLSEPVERAAVAELNLIAGRRARRSAAYRSASEYFAAGRALLPEDSWDSMYDLTLGLALDGAECEYLSGGFAEAERLLHVILDGKRTKTKSDAAAAASVKIYLHVIRDENSLAVDTAIDCLRLFGVELSPHPTLEQVQEEYAKVRRRLGDRPVEAHRELLQLQRRAVRRGRVRGPAAGGWARAEHLLVFHLEADGAILVG